MKQQRQQKFEANDRGYIAKNDDRQNDKHPSHKGKITLTTDTVRALAMQAKEEGEAVLYLAIWPGEKKGMLTVKAEAPLDYRGKDRQPARESMDRSVAPKNRRPVDEDDLDDEEIPF